MPDPCNAPYEVVSTRGPNRVLYCQRELGHGGIHRRGISAPDMRRLGYRRDKDNRFVKSEDPRA